MDNDFFLDLFGALLISLLFACLFLELKEYF